MEKQEIKRLLINNEIIELPFPVEIIPYIDNSGTIGSLQHTYVIQMGQIIIEIIKGFMKRMEKEESK